MPIWLLKSVGGLTPAYYFRQLFFSCVMTASLVYILMQSPNPPGFGIFVFFALNTLLYPYSRFAYESVVEFILGNNVFFVNAIMMMVVKIFTMAMCWACAICVAPLGLAYLFFHHSRSGARD